MFKNNAAYLAAYGTALEVRDAPYPSPSEGQIIIRNHAIAINPVDWAVQSIGDKMFPWLKLPAVLGSDVAGDIVEVAPNVTRFKIGDRVVGQALGFQHNSSAEGGFQEYTVLCQSMSCVLPETIAYENAVVLPLALGTASSGLFQEDFLALEHPTSPPVYKGKGILIWGGSTSVGCNAVQLATAAGYDVVSTSSPKNFELVKRLGAKVVFDYNSSTIIDDIVNYLQGKIIAGAFAIGATTAPGNGTAVGEACLEIVRRCEGRKFVAMAMVGPADKAPEGVKAKFVTSEKMKDNEVGEMIYGNFLPNALAKGTFLCAPEAVVIEKGIEKIQEALDLQKKGVSAKKIVVKL